MAARKELSGLAVLGSLTLDGNPVPTTGSAVLSLLLPVDGPGSGLNADLLDGIHASSFAQLAGATFTGTINAPTVRVGGVDVWHPGNDGSGTGLDADLLDGDHASAFAKLDGAVFTGGVTATGFTGPGGGLTGLNGSQITTGSVANARLASMTAGTVKGRALGSNGTPVDLTAAQLLAIIATVDGPGSGLDADTLDGDHAAAFAKLSGAVFTGGVTATGFTGPGGGLTGVDAATLGGQAASAYALLAGATFTGAVSAASLAATGGITAGAQLEISNANYGQHLKLTRSTESWQLNPSTDGSLDLRRITGTGTARLDLAADLTVTGRVVAEGNLYLGESLVEAHNGTQGGYGDGNGTGTNWGVPIWSMGDAYIGTSPGVGFVPGTYTLAWLRATAANALADVGEGLYAYRAGTNIFSAGHVGAYFNQQLKVNGNTLLQGLGVGGASPDATNKFAFYGTNMLFNSGGSIDATFNKNAAGNDASFSFKTGFAARALLGLLGDDNFTLKVGSGFNTALVAEHTTGRVTFPQPVILASQSSAPAAPPSDTLALYARRRAGADWPEVQRPTGRDVPLQPHFGLNRVATWSPNSGASVVVSGMPRTAVGTASTPALASTNLSTSMRRWRMTSAATANSVADERSAATLCFRGNAAGRGGFTYTNRVSLVTLQANAVAFFGLLASTAALSTTQTIAALVNCVGIGFTNGVDTNWQLIYNDGSGAPTQVDLGASFPVNSTTNVYTLVIYCAQNGSAIGVRVVNEVSGAAVEYSLTSDIPGTTTFLSVRNYMNNGGAAAAVAYDCSGVYLETDY